ncbi:RHTO0S02e02366g1_1 [Rhodotorula toruloides]|uniref:small monomeric GTPase n=1 Tax=Rhodotorula toruloides TaxID=5286 RepID=A0A061AMD2_RHOTO|nr:putative small G-protein Ras2 [Rhodotorula toruloides]CDR36453.1 RHTO0S02e02366g1_1 [Rhodotorula toruloides]
MNTVKLVMLGEGGVGKTAISLRVAMNYFVETYDPTIEDSYRTTANIDGQTYLLEILDTAGQEEYTALRDQWIREGEGFLVVYSTTSRASFDSVEKFCRQIARVKDSNRVPIVLVGNKIDRVHEREVETRHGEELARRLGCGFVETSAKTRENLEEVYCTAVRMIEQQRGGSTANPVKKKKKPRKCSIL